MAQCSRSMGKGGRMTTFNINNARLALKGFVTLWVPILVAIFPNLFPTTLSAVAIMAALTGSIDLLFRVWNVGDSNAG